MKFCSFFTILFLLFINRSSAEEQPRNHPVSQDDSFTVIYNGKDLSNLETEGNWQIQEDGSLQLTPRKGETGWDRFGSYLWLKGEYGDFVVDFEFKFAAGGNSGLFFRCEDTIDPAASGFEIQILDSHGLTKEKLGHHDMGGVIKTIGALENAAKPAGEWQKLTVSMKGNHLVAVLNGKLIQDINLEENKPKDKKLVNSGRISIQDHGLPFSVRNIRAKKL